MERLNHENHNEDMKNKTDDKDMTLLDDFFKEAAEMQIDDDGFTERVTAALPERKAVENKAMERLKRKSRIWNVVCLAAGVALFVGLRGWNVFYDLKAMSVAAIMTIDYSHLLVNTLPLLLLMPLAATATMLYFGFPELSKRW